MGIGSALRQSPAKTQRRFTTSAWRTIIHILSAAAIGGSRSRRIITVLFAHSVSLRELLHSRHQLDSPLIATVLWLIPSLVIWNRSGTQS